MLNEWRPFRSAICPILCISNCSEGARRHHRSLSQQALSDLQQACGGDSRERRPRTVPAGMASLVLDASLSLRSSRR